MVGSHYRCSQPKCDDKAADPAYCVSVYANNNTAEAEFMLFDKVARGAIDDLAEVQIPRACDNPRYCVHVHTSG